MLNVTLSNWKLGAELSVMKRLPAHQTPTGKELNVVSAKLDTITVAREAGTAIKQVNMAATAWNRCSFISVSLEG